MLGEETFNLQYYSQVLSLLGKYYFFEAIFYSIHIDFLKNLGDDLLNEDSSLVHQHFLTALIFVDSRYQHICPLLWRTLAIFDFIQNIE